MRTKNDQYQSAALFLVICINTAAEKNFPRSSFEAMKAEVERTDEAAALKDRIQQLRTEHDSDLELLYDSHANDYLNEVMDRYASMAEFPSDDVEGMKTLVRSPL